MANRLRTIGRCSRTTDAPKRETARSRALDREFAAESRPQTAQKPPKRPEIHRQDAAYLDGTTNKGSNHPKMEGFFPCLPLNPLHPRADGDAVAAGFKKEIPFSYPELNHRECRVLVLDSEPAPEDWPVFSNNRRFPRGNPRCQVLPQVD